MPVNNLEKERERRKRTHAISVAVRGCSGTVHATPHASPMPIFSPLRSRRRHCDFSSPTSLQLAGESDLSIHTDQRRGRKLLSPDLRLGWRWELGCRWVLDCLWRRGLDGLGGVRTIYPHP
ncbi:hypothetical protein TIFTF001_012426 [Ficus carica]|uniref:Uncharacterized protein n=1 Tax=Ficus carica TaxID=3494 RepID=A0AA88A1P1_FICCA|nr:hypothetical protein TIFTF001_012426 [Ficus carica]